MGLTKESITDKVECLADHFHVLQIRERNVVKEDGVIIAEKFHRRSLAPGYKNEEDVYVKTNTDNEQETSVLALVSGCWTDEVHESYALHLGATIPNA